MQHCLVSDEASFVCCYVLNVDGGFGAAGLITEYALRIRRWD